MKAITAKAPDIKKAIKTIAIGTVGNKIPASVPPCISATDSCQKYLERLVICRLLSIDIGLTSFLGTPPVGSAFKLPIRANAPKGATNIYFFLTSILVQPFLGLATSWKISGYFCLSFWLSTVRLPSKVLTEIRYWPTSARSFPPLA